MVKKDVTIGATYVCKVSNKLTTVKILRESDYGGWDARNEDTGRAVRIKTARRLHYAAHRFVVKHDRRYLTGAGQWADEVGQAVIFRLSSKAVRFYLALPADFIANSKGAKLAKAPAV